MFYNKLTFFKQLVMKNIFFIVCAIFLFISCTPKIAVKVDKNSNIVAEIDIKPTLATKKLIKSFSGFAEGSSSASEEVNIQNEKTKDGVEIIKFKKTASLEVEAIMKFPPSHDALSSIFELNQKEKKLICSLNRQKLKSFFDNLSQQDKEYIELLMAPSFQDEKMSEDEYIQIISNAYGNTIANELKNSSVLLEFKLPNKIKNLSITPKSEYKLKGDAVECSIPLSRILVLDSPIDIIIQY